MINQKHEKFEMFFFIFLSLSMSVIIGYLKISNLTTWQYSSDLFSFDTVLQETLKGNIGLDFTYGNAFGDHAYIFIFLLLPIKFFLKTKTVYFLILLCPLFYFLSAISVYFTFRQNSTQLKTLFVSLIYLFGFGFYYKSMSETFYGFHPDMFAGFLAVIFTCLLISGNKLNNFSQNIGFVLVFLFFISIKEEFAILGTLYLAIICFFYQTKPNFTFLTFSVVFTIFDFFFIRFFQTPFNRTNKSLLLENLKLLQTNKLDFFSKNPSGEIGIFYFWTIILIIIFAFLSGLIITKKKNPCILALFITGLAEIFTGILVSIFIFSDWHIFPGVIMVLAGTLIQFFYFEPKSISLKKLQLITASILLMISLSTFVFTDLKYAWKQHLNSQNHIEIIKSYETEIEAIKDEIDIEKIISIPPMAAINWVDGYRYTFYPNGVTARIPGIADYILYPTDVPFNFTGGFERSLPFEYLGNDFEVIQETAHFTLLQRIHISSEHIKSRNSFFDYFPQ